MKMNSFFTRTRLLCKHIVKMPVIGILLLLIPAVTLVFRFLPEHAVSSGLTVGIYFENNDDELTDRVKALLLSSEGKALDFAEYDDRGLMENDVIRGRLECGYIFSNSFSEALAGGRYKNSVEVIKSPSTMMLSAANEIVFAAVVRLSGYETLDDYIHIEGLDGETTARLGEYMYQSYEAYCAGGETFHLDIRTANNLSLNGDTSDAATVTFPLRGLLSILIMLAALSGSIAWLSDRENGIFAPRPRSFVVLSFILYPLLPAVLFTLCTELALALNGSAYSPLTEFMYSVRYIFLVTAFSCACCLLKRSRRVIPLVPVLLLGSLIFCPIFMNIENFFPVFRFISRLFIPRYFL